MTSATASSLASRSKWKTALRKSHDKAFKHLDKAGVQVGRISNKLGVENFWPGPMSGEIQKAVRILHKFTYASLSSLESQSGRSRKLKALAGIPPKLIREAEGLAIFTVFRTGLVLSAASGSGVVIARNEDRSWGLPSGILIHTIGYGFLAGIDVYDVVLILRNRKAVKAFMNPKVSLGAEISVAAGDTGAGAMVDTGIEAVPVISYTKSKGVYGGIQLDGNIIIERKDENARFYGHSIKTRDILSGSSSASSSGGTLRAPVGSVEPLYRAIAEAELERANESRSHTQPAEQHAIVDPFADSSAPVLGNAGTNGATSAYTARPSAELHGSARRSVETLPRYEYRAAEADDDDDLYFNTGENQRQPLVPEKSAGFNVSSLTRTQTPSLQPTNTAAPYSDATPDINLASSVPPRRRARDTPTHNTGSEAKDQPDGAGPHSF